MSTTHTTTRWGSWRRRLLLAVVGAVGALALTGCRKPLFATPVMSQYERYDRWRDDYLDPYVVDAWGDRRPNLRARLVPPQ